MSNILAIARRDLNGYFNSTAAYLLVVVYLNISSFLFFTQLFLEGNADMRPFFSTR